MLTTAKYLHVPNAQFNGLDILKDMSVRRCKRIYHTLMKCNYELMHICPQILDKHMGLTHHVLINIFIVMIATGSTFESFEGSNFWFMKISVIPHRQMTGDYDIRMNGH